MELKQRGIKDGSKYFNIPLKKGRVATTISKLSLDALRASSKTSKKIMTSIEKEIKTERQRTVQLKTFRTGNINKKKILKKLSVGPENTPALRNTGFNIRFTPTKGVSEDELNSLEKIFYSFQKRTFETYIMAYISSYNKMILQKPTLKKSLQQEVHHLTGKVTFDREGNITVIKILRWSSDDNVQDLFEETLKAMKRLPNPPRAIVEDREEFDIYYQLKINTGQG